MDFLDFKAGPNDDGRRLDKILRSLAENYSLPQLYKFMRKGLVRLNGKKVKPESRVSAGDIIQVAGFIIGPEKSEIKNSETIGKIVNQPKIVFENENFLVVNKDYDISVHGNKDSLDFLVNNYLKNKSAQEKVLEESLSFRPGPLHRLDRKTSGLLVFSKSLSGARWFSQNINDHSVNKIYCALLQGKLEGKQDWIDYIYAREESGRNFHTVEASHKQINEDWKLAKSQLIPLAYGSYEGMDVTLAQIQIFTGRKHQIRAQASLNGYPLLGDTAYKGKSIKGFSRDFYLAAVKLQLQDKLLNNELAFPAELSIDISEDFFDIIKYCDIKYLEI